MKIPRRIESSIAMKSCVYCFIPCTMVILPRWWQNNITNCLFWAIVLIKVCIPFMLSTIAPHLRVPWYQNIWIIVSLHHRYSMDLPCPWSVWLSLILLFILYIVLFQSLYCGCLWLMWLYNEEDVVDSELSAFGAQLERSPWVLISPSLKLRQPFFYLVRTMPVSSC